MAAEFSPLRKGCAECDDLRFAMIGIWQRFYPAPLRECLENLAYGLTADTQVPGDVRRALSASSDVDDNERLHARRTGIAGSLKAVLESLVEPVDRVHQAGQNALVGHRRSEEHTSELQSLMRISYAVFCLKQKRKKTRR